MLDDAYFAGYKIMKNKQKWSYVFNKIKFRI